jgi:hypothetical protein
MKNFVAQFYKKPFKEQKDKFKSVLNKALGGGGI